MNDNEGRKIQYDVGRTKYGEHRSTFHVQGSNFYDLEDRLLEYAARIVRLTEAMAKSQAGKHVSRQLLRSGTAPHAHHGEAQGAESPDDFIHKLRIGLKELRESRRWLRLIHRVPLVSKPTKVDPLLQETEELTRIFVASIGTARKNKERRRSDGKQ